MPVRGKRKRDHRFDNVDDALILFNKMIEKYLKPSIFVSMYRHLELLGVFHNVYSMGILINCICQLDRFDFGFSFLGKMLKLGVEPSAATFSILIIGLCKQSKISEAVCMFDEMTERGYQPDLIAGNTDRAVRFLRLMEDRGFEPNIGLLKEALNLFTELKVKGIRPDVVAYSCLIHGMCNLGQLEEAPRLLNEMVDNNISLNIVTYTILIGALCKKRMISKAVEIVDTMRKQGIEPNVVTYSTLVDAHCKEGRVSEAEDFVDAMIKRGIEPNVVTYNALINGHCLQNKMDKARRVFNLMIEKGCAPDIVTYSTMINGYCKGHIEEAWNLFQAMQNSGLELDIVPYTVIIDGLCKAGHIKVAKELFHQLSDNGLKPDGLPDEAYRLFGCMRDNDCSLNRCCYNVMIRGFLRNSYTSKATQLLTEMVGKGISADIFTATLFMDLIVHSNKSILL
ncbi:hypothetical protein V6Z12_A04G045600 [Gossypium hirsutum]